MTDYNADICISLLKEKYSQLDGQRFPKKDDFSQDEVVAIKAFLGPWPRALEKAGLKKVDTEKLEKKQQKRIEAKRRATLRKTENKKTPE